MSTQVSDHVATLWLAHFIGKSWFALCVTDPARSGLNESEVVGGSYKRMKGTMAHLDARTIWLTDKLEWHGMPHVILSHVAIADAAVNGNLMSSAMITTPQEVLQGASFTMDAYTYSISIGIGNQ